MTLSPTADTVEFETASTPERAVPLKRLTYDRITKAVTHRSDKSEGRTAATDSADPPEFTARMLVHIPDSGHVTTVCSGWSADRPRGMRRHAQPARRWAAFLQQISVDEHPNSRSDDQANSGGRH